MDDLSLEPARARALGGMAMLIWFDKRKGGCEGKEGRVRASERASAFDDRCPLPWVSADRLWARGFARDGQSMESAVVASTSAVGATMGPEMEAAVGELRKTQESLQSLMDGASRSAHARSGLPNLYTGLYIIKTRTNRP